MPVSAQTGTAGSDRILIHGLLPAELAALCRGDGQPEYRARQVWNWLYVRRADTWAAMKNLPYAWRARLAERFDLRPAAVDGVEGGEGETRKLLLGLRDGERIEAVLIPAAPRLTVCVSTQAGCRFACAFCASGRAGFARQLEAGEIVGQALAAAATAGRPPTHVVFMGIGEPLDNYDAVLRAARILNDADGLAIGARRITLSTCGLVPGIRRLAGEGLQIELSVSLHATDDALRTALMPVNRRYPLAELMDACRDYAARTRRLITFEYTLIRGLNDSRAHAEALARLLRGLLARVNLIPLSPVAEFPHQPPPPGTAEMFVKVLDAAGINATVRRSQGSRIRAACGQLRYGGRRE